MPQQPIDYTMRYQIRSGRVNFADYVQRRQLIQDGALLGLNLLPPDNDASIVPNIQDGAVNTTPAEYAEYLAAAIAEEPTGPTVPTAPTNLVATPGNGQAIIAFTAPSDGGSPITNYEYWITDASGGGFEAFSPPVTASPVTITGLPNGTTLHIRIRAVNAAGPGAQSEIVEVTPNVQEVIQTFTTVGSTTWTAPAGVTSVDYLVVGGGGGGGGSYDTGAGGGGGGGLALYEASYTVTPGVSYTVIVGDGGSGGVGIQGGGGDGTSTTGGNSQFGTIVASGGGAGGGSLADRTGGGGTQGNAGLLTAPSGGKGGRNPENTFGAGGGGGMGSAGATSVSATNAAGGSGIPYSISGSNVTYGAGGNGGVRNVVSTGSNGTINTGNGGQGSGSTSGQNNNGRGGKGGSGIVILKYLA
jgi:hypothetical protein